MRILVTGGAGFIGSAFVRMLVREHGHEVLNLDKLTYAASPDALEEVASRPALPAAPGRHLRRGGSGRRPSPSFAPDAVVHLAAESHVDRSIDGPGAFVQTNVVGTYVMLDAALAYWRALPADRREAFRFVHVSTDEVYGSLGPEGRFTETHALRPELALRGEQGRGRSSGARLAPHLRPAGDRHQLLEQLRPLPVSREADPAHHHQGRRRRAAAGLRQGRERARLDPCRRPRPRHPCRADPRPGRARATISAAPASA